MGEFVDFDRKDGRGGYIGTDENPIVTVTKEGVYLGADVWRGILDEAAYVHWLVDAEDSRVGVRPVDDAEAGANAYSVSEFQARAKPVWDSLGVKVNESVHVPLDVESEDFPVIDVSEFVEGESDGESGGDTPDTECEVCGRGFGGEAGKNIHKARMHDADEGDDPGNDEDDGSVESEPEDPDDVLDHERVETAMDQVGIDETVGVNEFIDAVDLFKRTFQISSKLGITRASADDLIRRLDLEDALDERDGHVASDRYAEGEFGGEDGEGGEAP